jgi:ribose-phosphate pyrophosphokinase
MNKGISKLGPTGVAAQTGVSASKLEQALGDLRGAASLTAIGDQLRKIAELLPGDDGASAIAPALTGALRSEPDGLRPLAAEVGTGRGRPEVSIFLGTATPDRARERAQGEVEDAVDFDARIETHSFKIFSTGDPFAFLGTPPDKKEGVKANPADVKGREVYVFQGDVDAPENAETKFDRATLVAEALQIAFAARENGSTKTVVVLPEALDPAKNPNDKFAQLVARLAEATGVDGVRYSSEVSTDGAVDRDVRGGLPPLGPKARDATQGLASLETANDLAGVKRALGTLDVALMGLSKFAEGPAFTRQVVDVLCAKVQSLVPGIPSGAAAVQDDRVVVFSGQSNPDLAAKLTGALGAEQGDAAVRFEGGVPYPTLGTKVEGRPVVVVQTSRQDPETAADKRSSSMALLTEALMLCDEAIKSGAEDVSLVLPYMPNARSDRMDQKGVGAYASLVSRWVDAIGVKKVVLVEPHDPHTPHFFRTRNIRVVSGAEVLAKDIIGQLGRKDLVFVRPDAGAQKRMASLAKAVDLPLVDGEKSRADNEENAEMKSLGGKSEVAGKRCLVVDDEIATGGTMRQTVTMLREGGAKEVHVAVSHANMPMEPEKRHQSMRQLRDEAGATKLYLLDTQPVGDLPADLKDFVQVIPVASAIGEEIY